MRAILLLLAIWIGLVLLAQATRADHNDVYSIYLERANYIHEVDSGRVEYNMYVDIGYGIDLQNACEARGRSNPKHCWYNMLFQIGAEVRAYRGF